MFIKDLITYIKHRKVINQMIKAENLMQNMGELFKTRFRQDWIGRIYTVINPVVNGNINDIIIEYDTEGANIRSYINKYVMDRMIAVNNFIINHELFDILTYDIKQLDDDYNFLFVMTPIAWFDFKHSIKRVLIELSVLLAIAAITTITLILI